MKRKYKGFRWSLVVYVDGKGVEDGSPAKFLAKHLDRINEEMKMKGIDGIGIIKFEGAIKENENERRTEGTKVTTS